MKELNMENANDHPFKVSIVKDAEFFANSHPYKVSIEGGGGNEGRVVDELPEEGEPGYIYLVLKESSPEGDIYDEYMWVLQQDGETYGWEHIGATNEVTITLYDGIGTNTDGAMTQDATSKMIYTSPDAEGSSICIGQGTTGSLDSAVHNLTIGYRANTGSNTSGFDNIRIGSYVNSLTKSGLDNGEGQRNIAIGYSATNFHTNGNLNESGQIAIGNEASTVDKGAIAFGNGAYSQTCGEINVGTTDIVNQPAYNGTAYRLISGVHDPINAHDVATKGYVDENSGVKLLTTADYNYDYGNTGSNNTVALWLLDEGLYRAEEGVNVSPTSSVINAVDPLYWKQCGNTYLVGPTYTGGSFPGKQIIAFHNKSLGMNNLFKTVTKIYIRTNDLATGTVTRWDSDITQLNIANDLTTTTANRVLDARQGKVLNDKIGQIETVLQTLTIGNGV